MAGEEVAQQQTTQEFRPLDEAGKNWNDRRRSEPLWYIVRAEEGKDSEICLALVKLNYECERFVRKVKFTRRVMVQGVERIDTLCRKIPLFGPHVFVKEIMTPTFRSAVDGMPGVEGFLCYAGSEDPASVPEELIEFYRRGDSPICARQDPGVASTDIVRVIIGPASGIIGVTTSVMKGGIKIDSRDRRWPGVLFAKFGDFEVVERGKGAAVAAAAGKQRRNAHA
jgi:transcription antitermination factor NusG